MKEKNSYNKTLYDAVQGFVILRASLDIQIFNRAGINIVVH